MGTKSAVEGPSEEIGDLNMKGECSERCDSESGADVGGWGQPSESDGVAFETER